MATVADGSTSERGGDATPDARQHHRSEDAAPEREAVRSQDAGLEQEPAAPKQDELLCTICGLRACWRA
jgi:hypothetical protein